MPRKKLTLTKRVNRLETVSRPEVKYRDQESGAFDAVGSVSGTLLQPMQLAETVGRNGRVGNKVKSKNIRFQAILKMPGAPNSSTCAVRILVLRSKIEDPTTSDMPNWYGAVDEDKFFVIKDILTQVSSRFYHDGTSALSGSTVKRINFNIKTGFRKLQYDGQGLQSPSNNEYIIYMLAESGDAQVAWNLKHFYIDN